MIRRNGKLQRDSWDEAMSLIVEKAKDVKERLTAHGIGFYTIGQLFLVGDVRRATHFLIRIA
jgi:ferredoxin-nitrate reductase